MSVAPRERRLAAAHRLVPPVAAVAALGVLIDGLATAPPYTPRWPLTVSIVILGLGLAAGRLAQLAGRPPVQRAAHTISAVAALVVIVDALSRVDRDPTAPGAVAAVLLGIGLAAGPLGRLIDGPPVPRSAQTVAAVAAIVVLVDGLARASQYAVHWPSTIPLVILGAGLAAGRLAQLAGGPPVSRSAQPAAAVAALVVLIDGLSRQLYATSRWPWVVAIVLLGVGLIIGPLLQYGRLPRKLVLSQRVDELSRTRRGALDVQATELRRIERDLHDGAQARLVALSMKLGRAEDRYRDDPQTAALLREAREDAAAAIRELRELARGIAPPVLTDRGLEAAVRSLAQRSGATVTVRGELERRPLPAVETAAYFVVAESLTNAAKHAPGARVEARLDERGGDLFVEVTDFGPGGADPAGGGLTGLRQRVEALDGALHVTSPAGVGTQVEAVLPCGR